ncbi:hypothetical protein [Chitinophaga sp. LS1]|uniref:hypothetical protein n=1 Tax=Chitinophaga sp. LS1 TaxID=3051176 RepID=UPI002AAC481C|nr:hypothetical protein [Chitinophaga sp. LS1]WPV65952.1 hypothetical protein QQL36_29565 [Chitinophaga sp. LS1]
MRIELYIILLLSGFLYSCKKQDDEYQLNDKEGIALNDILSFEAVDTQIVPADNVSYAEVTVRIARLADTIGREVTFSSKDANWENDDSIIVVSANSDGLASARIRSTAVGKVRVKATVAKYYSIDTSVTFSRAYAEYLLLESDKYEGDTTESFTITASLLRDQGVVTDHTMVLSEVISRDTSLSLIAPEIVYTEQDKATILVANPFRISGRFELRVATLKASGDTLRKSLVFRIK